MVFGPFWSENGYIHFAHFGVELGMVYEGCTKVYEVNIRYLSFQFQMSKKGREICKFEMHLKNFFVCTLI